MAAASEVNSFITLEPEDFLSQTNTPRSAVRGLKLWTRGWRSWLRRLTTAPADGDDRAPERSVSTLLAGADVTPTNKCQSYNTFFFFVTDAAALKASIYPWLVLSSFVALFLNTSIRLGWKKMPSTNTSFLPQRWWRRKSFYNTDKRRQC